MSRARITALIAFGIPVAVLVWAVAEIARYGSWSNLGAGQGVFLPLIVVAFSATGLALVFKVPENRIGWVYLMSGLLGGLAVSFTGIAMATDPSQPGWAYLGAVGSALYFPWILSTVALPVLLFPTGRPPSERWRFVGWVISTTMVIAFVTFLTNPTVEIDSGVAETVIRPNPLTVEWLDPLRSPVGGLVGLTILFASLILPMAAIVVRFRNSSGIARLQMKWFVYVATIAGVGLALTYGLGEFDLFWLDLATTLGVVGLLAIPIATGLAITRYRLYDIDRLISRTISYALLVALLSAVYFGSVILIGLVLPSREPIIIATSTLLVVTLLTPLRKWIQERIDRRFYRARYDGQRVLEELGHRLQDELDVDVLAAELVDATQSAVKPERIGLWVRSSTGSEL